MVMSTKVMSGSNYSAHTSEMAHLQDRTPKTVSCIVHFLDDTIETFEVDKRGKAQHLLDKVFEHLELVEKDYFGLQYLDLAPGDDTLRWLDPLKTIKKQCRGPTYEFFFRVKFYVSDPSKLAEEYTRYHFFLQVKRDILSGKLVCSDASAGVLASYAVQSEIGDFNPDEHTDDYLSGFLFIPNQTCDFLKLVAEKHKQHRGQTPADAEYNFLERSKRLEMYGVDLHSARDQNSTDIQLGVTSAGLVVFQNNVKIHTFSWAKIVKISFKRKQFFIQLRREVGSSEPIENLIGFNMVSYRSCKNLWKSCVEHHTFFRVHHPNPPAKKMFPVGSQFRSSSKRYRRTVGAVSREAILEENRYIDSYRQMSKSQTFSGNSPSHDVDTATSTTVNNSGNHSFSRQDGVSSQVRATLPHNYKSVHSWEDGNQSQPKDEDSLISHGTRETYSSTVTTKAIITHSNKADNCSQNGNVTNNQATDSLYELPCYDEFLPNGNSHPEGQGLVTIRMKPDEKGRFGFNVKGGADQGMPIIVSRVAPNTAADLAIPRLNEGDQVLFINGRDVSQHTHEQVVMFIKASRETHSGELTLVVRPNVQISEDPGDEPDYSYIPETHQIASTSSSANTLESSLMLLQESLESGAAIAQFEQLYRKKPGLTLNAARLDANINKNRYRDISPYDQTRVVLKSAASGDYINANFVNMEIPDSGIINRYIAAQGPLPNTCTDFWQMIWEQRSTIVVMLTTKVERGRVKCHQYWPQLFETEDFGTLQVTCVKEEDSNSFSFRDFNLNHVETGETRHIKHMQYIAWPDHGVPDDPSDFLHFVMLVRQNRKGTAEPTVVHCSAGIGRTGVLITMETAMCLIESNQQVYPLSIVRQMREQRAMLIQTSSQYKFVCEAILKVYNEGLAKPQEGFRR
ncbi:hypothetical protein BsWGS_04397 [Bradybaena similaris]